MHTPQQPEHVLDARGCPCPQPLIKTRRLWKTLNPGTAFRVLMDNEIAHTNLMTFLNDQNANPQTTRDGDDWIIDAIRSEGGQVSATSQAPVREEIRSTAETPLRKNQSDDYVVALKSDSMGQGDDDLGRILIKGYINTLRELDHKPSSIMLYNGGARLAEKDSGADVALNALADEGVDVIVCGACVDFFELKDTLAAGRISNMYEIAEKLAAAGHVVYP